MKPLGSLPIAALVAFLALAASAGSLRAGQTLEPAGVANLPYVEIFSPTFFWNDEADFIRVGSTTCPKGRAITGGVGIQQGKASLRILESYPDGESWVVRVVNRQKNDSVQSLQVRGFALCMLPAARKVSILMSADAEEPFSTNRRSPSGIVDREVAVAFLPYGVPDRPLSTSPRRAGRCVLYS